MREWNVSIEMDGQQVPVGRLIGNDITDVGFQYLESYLETPQPYAISLSLPIRREIYSPKETRNFFEGLLPEGFTKKSVARWMHVNEEDYLSILEGLGQECLGALRITCTDSEIVPSAYQRLSGEDVARLAGEGAVKSAEFVTKAHLSLTGASGKVGLYYEESTNTWYLPMGDAPSTHIVKQSHVRLNGLVTNEQLCLLTAKILGIQTPDSFIINTGRAEEGEVLFATKRYDRMFAATGEKINGLPRPMRLHQEDFAQAMGIASLDKYESEGGNYLERAFQLLANFSSNPMEDQIRLWDLMIFDYLIGNTDNHIKNLSLLYTRDLQGIRLAPAYDIVSTAIYEGSSMEMAISIDGKRDLNQIDRKAFLQEATKLSLGRKLAMRRFDDLADGMEAALKKSADLLMEQGFSNAGALCARILAHGGINRV